MLAFSAVNSVMSCVPNNMILLLSSVLASNTRGLLAVCMQLLELAAHQSPWQPFAHSHWSPILVFWTFHGLFHTLPGLPVAATSSSWFRHWKKMVKYGVCQDTQQKLLCSTHKDNQPSQTNN